jgi:hypothetical protein
MTLGDSAARPDEPDFRCNAKSVNNRTHTMRDEAAIRDYVAFMGRCILPIVVAVAPGRPSLDPELDGVSHS